MPLGRNLTAGFSANLAGGHAVAFVITAWQLQSFKKKLKFYCDQTIFLRLVSVRLGTFGDFVVAVQWQTGGRKTEAL